MRKLNALLGLGLLGVFFLPSVSQAGDAGCGLGSIVIQKNSKLLQLSALTTNGTFSSSAFGITFGTSNCSASGIVANDKQLEYFVEVNHHDLSREIAQGQGEKLQTLAGLYGCKDQNSAGAFAVTAKKSYGKVFESENPVEIVSQLNHTVKSDQNLVQLCKIQI